MSGGGAGAAQEPAWSAAGIKECDRACLVGILDGYMNAIYKRDPKADDDVRGGRPDVRQPARCRDSTGALPSVAPRAGGHEGQVARKREVKLQG